MLNIVVLIAASLYLVVLITEAFSPGVSRRWVVELALLLVGLAVLHLATGFPGTGGRQSFGVGADLGMIVSVFLAILAGMAARYFFYLRGKFRWRSFLKPLLVSPIVLLPLLGTLPFGRGVEAIQMVSILVLAFQNGFFWRVVFERAKETT